MHVEISSRFWAHVNRNASNGCWEWIGAHSTKGYGRFWLCGKLHQAHRIAYEAIIGPIPEAFTLDHTCRNPRCVNPVHLDPVDNRTNILRGNGPAAIQARLTHCKNGHPLNGDNLYIWHGHRTCRICKSIREKTYRGLRSHEDRHAQEVTA